MMDLIVANYLRTVVFLSTVFLSACQDSFYFDPAPVSQDVVEGEDLRLRCDVSSRRYITFYWTLDGKMLANTSRRYQDHSDLRILFVNRTLDSGSFRCVAVNVSTGIAVRSSEAVLNILWLAPPTLQIQQRLGQSDDGSSDTTELTIKCLAEGNPEPAVEWFRNRIRLMPNDRLKLMKSRLRLQSVSCGDNGVYSCRIRSAAGVHDSDNYLLNVPGGPLLDAQSFSSSLVVRRRSTALFNCLFANASYTAWYYDQIQLVNTDKYNILGNGTLVINEVDSDDAGLYRCVGGSSTSGLDQIFAAQLSIAFIDDVTDSSFEPRLTSPLVLPAGGKLDVRCRPPKGLPLPVSSWQGPSGSHVTERGHVKVVDGNNLVINDVDVADSGNYTCVVENMAGTKSRSVSVVVTVPPKIVKGPASRTETEGSTCTFDCVVNGSPYPLTVITWIKDGALVDTRDTRWRVSQSTGTLTISSIRASDEGAYSCLVTTKTQPPVSSPAAYLIIVKRLRFTVKPSNAQLTVGSNVSVSCAAEGTGITAPSVSWHRVGYAVLPSHVTGVGGQLRFRGVRQNDAGLYTCVATSAGQQPIDATIRVDVIVMSKPVNTSAVEGESTVLHCGTGEVGSVVHWDKNRVVHAFDTSRFQELENGSLYITEVQTDDSGWYGCTVATASDHNYYTAYLQIMSAAPTLTDVDGADLDADTTEGEQTTMTKTIVIAVCCVVAYLGVMVALTIYCLVHMVRSRRLRKLQSHRTLHTTSGDKSNGSVTDEGTQLMMTMLDRQPPSRDGLSSKNDLNHTLKSVSTTSPAHSVQYDINISSPSLQRFTAEMPKFPRHHLQILGLIGNGDYGDIMLARVDSSSEIAAQSLVVVKSLLTSTPDHQTAFRSEAELFARGSHQYHVARLLGVCSNVQPLLLVTEFCELGDLKRLLTSHSVSLSTAQRMSICHQSAVALSYIASQHFVHRDIAARNFLVSRSLDVRLSNVASARGADAADYCELGGKLVPLRWMAPETALTGNWSAASDVWAFGVYIGEVFSNAATPYPSLTDDEVLVTLASGMGRPICPGDCPDILQHLFTSCTLYRPHERPTASQLAATMDKIISNFS